MPKLIFIKNLEELNYIKTNLSHLLTTHKVFSICPLPWLQLHAQGFLAEQVSDYLSGDDFKNILQESRLLSRDWYKPFEHLLNYQGVNLGELVRLDQTWAFREIISSYLAFQRIIDAHKPDGIAIFADLDIPLTTTRSRGNNNIFASVAIWECTIKKIPIQKLSSPEGFNSKARRFWLRLKRKIGRYLPLALFLFRYLKRRMQSIIHYSAPNRILLSSFSKAPHQKLAVAFGNNFTLLILKEVMKTLSDLGDFNVVFLNRDTNFNATYLKSRSGLDVDNEPEFVSLEDFSSFRILEIMGMISSLQKARRCFASAGAPKIGFLSSLPSQLLRNPNLAVQFDFFWSEYFFEMVSMIDKLSDMYQRWKPDVVLTAGTSACYDRGLVKLASKYGVKSITVPHGWIGDIDDYDFESDLFLAWGELSREQLIQEFNKPAESIAVVGAMQFEKLIPSLRQSCDDIIKDAKKKFGLRLETPAVLIMSIGLAQFVFSAQDMKRFFEAWELMKLFIQRHPEIDFILRPHPACEGIEWYRHLIRDVNRPNLKIIEEAKIEAFLPAVDVGILIDGPTTAGYLCILFGIPLIFFKGSIKADFSSTIEAWSEANGILSAKQENDLIVLLERLLSDDKFRKETLEKEQGFLDKSLLVGDGKVEQRIAQAVRQLCK